MLLSKYEREREKERKKLIHRLEFYSKQITQNCFATFNITYESRIDSMFARDNFTEKKKKKNKEKKIKIEY